MLPPRVQTRTTQGTRCRVLSLSLIECIFLFHMCKDREKFSRKERRFLSSAKAPIVIPQKIREEYTHFERALFLLLNNFKWRSAAEEDSGARRTSRNPRSGKRRRRRSEEEEEEASHRVVREDSVPLPINKEALEVCLVNRRVGWSEGLDNNNNNKPEVASWVDSGSRNNKPGASRRERVRFVNFAHQMCFDFQFSIRFCVRLLLSSLSLSFASNNNGFLLAFRRSTSRFRRSIDHY